MSTNQWFMKITDCRNERYVILDNGLMFKVGVNKSIMLPRRLVMKLKTLYERYSNSVFKRDRYQKNVDGLFTFKFRDSNIHRRNDIVIKTMHNFEVEAPIQELLYYIASYL